MMKRKTLLFGAALLAALAVTGCDSAAPADRPIGLMDRLWLPEDGQYTPFYVLDQTPETLLLLREHTTGPSLFCEGDSMNTYYAGSALDSFLNTEYACRFSDEIRAYFVEIDVVITAEAAIGYCGRETESIRRVFFAPSWTEITGRSNNVCLREGVSFAERLTASTRAATTDGGAPSVWWLRTPNTWYPNIVLCVNEEGGMASAMTMTDGEAYPMDVRPAFRVSAGIPIVREDGQWRVRTGTQ